MFLEISNIFLAFVFVSPYAIKLSAYGNINGYKMSKTNNNNETTADAKPVLAAVKILAPEGGGDWS